MLKKVLIVALLLFSSFGLRAQETVEMMFYNVLNFPNPVPDGRWDTLRTILEYRPVDILMICELKTEEGADLILNESLNVNGETSFARAEYVPQQSNPGSSWPLQQMLFYDSDRFTLQSQDYQLTQRRDINEYVLYYNDPDLAVHQDTSFLDIYVLHLKSGDGDYEEGQRKRMVDSLYAHLVDRPGNRNLVLAGDFNVYSSQDDAYQRLTNAAEGGVFVDPLQTPGNWHNSYDLRNVHTQSSRTGSIFGDGSGGGMDDRFDFILLSGNMFGDGDFAYWPGSYSSLGNTGDCFNDGILDCDEGSYPEYLLRSLFNMSDHLPVYLELLINEAVPNESLAARKAASWSVINSFGGDGQLSIWLDSPLSSSSDLHLYDQCGRLVRSEKMVVSAGLQQYSYDMAGLPSGTYFLLAPELRLDLGLRPLKFVGP